MVFVTVFSCGDGDKGPSITTYTGKDTAGAEYKLVVTDDTYLLVIGDKEISTGKVSKSGDTLTLTPNGGDGTPFKVTVSGNSITGFEGEITDDNGTKIPSPEILPPFTAVAGNWNWFTSDDSKTNEYLDVQTTFPPGGVSRITNAVDVTGPDGEPGKGPFTYTTPVTDNDGKTITVPVYNFTGNTKVDPNKNSAQKFGAGWPLVGWEAQPADEETKALLKTAYGYSFWVRLNSSLTNNKDANNWAFLTAVVTDFPIEKGYEYKHWFGNKAGDSGGSKVNNLTKGLEAGTWYKITVIMNKDGFNMDEDKWLYQWPPNPDPKKPFNQAAAEKIQWQIPLQHNGGAQRNGDPYDQVTGTYDFNLDFYGLELLIK